MAYSGGIKFIADLIQDRMVPHLVDLSFTDDGEALNAKVRKFSRDCRIEDKEEEYAIIDGMRQVGSL